MSSDFSARLTLAFFVASCVFMTAAWPDETAFYRFMAVALQLAGIVSVIQLLLAARSGS